MNKITNHIKNSLQKDGYVVIDLNISSEILKAAQNAYFDVTKKVDLKKYKYIRVNDDYIGMNVSGIEMPFHPIIIDKRIVDLLNHSNAARTAIEILGEKVKMTVSRYHITKKFSHIGNWHRDNEPEKIDSVQMNIFLFDEKGLEVIPGSHKRKYTQYEKNILEKSNRSELPNSKHLSAKAGSIVIFNSAIIHRGKSSKPRANIHFRFERDQEYLSNRYEDLVGFNNDWLNILNNKNTKIIDNSIMEYNHSKKISDLIRRLIRTFIHYGIFWLPLNSSIYRKTGAYPSLNMRIFFKLI